jgi:hypothetical protein
MWVNVSLRDVIHSPVKFANENQVFLSEICNTEHLGFAYAWVCSV